MIRVLHVDDDKLDLDLVSKNLSQLIEGLEIDPAESVAIALEKTEQGEYDCILSDFKMADASGIDLLQSLRLRGDQTPFIFLTGQGNEQVAADALRAGANDYYFKSESQALFERLSNCILGQVERAEQQRLRAEAEEALQASEELYRSTLSSIADAILLADEAGKLVFASGNVNGIFGLSPEDAIALGDLTALLDLPEDFFDNLKSEGEIGNIECETKDFFGNERTLSIHAKEVRFRDARFLFTCRDIGERKKALEAIKSERQLLLNILDGFPIANFVIDTEHKLISWNRACENLTGLPRSEVLGKPVDPSTFYPDEHENHSMLADIVLRQDFEGLSECLGDQRVIESSIVPDGFELERKLTSGGKEYIAYLLAAPLRDRDGKVVGAVETIQDISHRVHVENELRLSEEKYRAVVENANDAIFVLQDAHAVFCNQKMLELTGLGWEELSTMPAIELVHPAYRTDIETMGKIATDSGKTISNLEFQIVHDEDTRWVSANLVGVTWEGKPALLVFAADITKRKQAEDEARANQRQLMQASKMAALGTLISGVAHEINNPNNFIMLNTPILYETWESALPILESYYEENGEFLLGGHPYSEMRETIPHLFTGVNEGSKRIKSIVQNLRDFARQDTSDLSQRVNVNTVIESAVNLLSNQIKQSTNNFDMQLGKNVPGVRGNHYRLEQVVMNLILNSCQALTDKDSGIFVSSFLDTESKRVMITVRDEGSGISPDTIQYIQDPFFTTKRDSGGTGLGLSISSGIIDDHGGELDFVSKPGEGTTATITLPPITERTGS